MVAIRSEAGLCLPQGGGELSQKAKESESQAIGIDITPADLAMLILAVKFAPEEWRFGHALQVPHFDVSRDPQMDDLATYLRATVSFTSEGDRSRGYTVFRPRVGKDTDQARLLDYLKSQCLDSTCLENLLKLVSLKNQIGSITVLQNSSLPFKLNGMIIHLNEIQDPNKFPLSAISGLLGSKVGRNVCLLVLEGIDFDSFVDHFYDGSGLVSALKNKFKSLAPDVRKFLGLRPLTEPTKIKYVSFYYNKEGAVYVLVAGGGQTMPQTTKRLQENMADLIREERDFLLELTFKSLQYIIGGGVKAELFLAAPYIYIIPDLEKGKVVSGAVEGPEAIFNYGIGREVKIITDVSGIVPIGSSRKFSRNHPFNQIEWNIAWPEIKYNVQGVLYPFNERKD